MLTSDSGGNRAHHSVLLSYLSDITDVFRRESRWWSIMLEQRNFESHMTFHEGYQRRIIRNLTAYIPHGYESKHHPAFISNISQVYQKSTWTKCANCERNREDSKMRKYVMENQKWLVPKRAIIIARNIDYIAYCLMVRAAFAPKKNIIRVYPEGNRRWIT